MPVRVRAVGRLQHLVACFRIFVPAPVGLDVNRAQLPLPQRILDAREEPPLLLLLADFALSPKPGQFRLKRINDAKLSLGADNLIRINARRVDGEVSGVRARPISFTVRDEPPTDYVLSAMFLPGSVLPNDEVELTYTARPVRRGDYKFGGCWLRYTGVLGLLVLLRVRALQRR